MTELPNGYRITDTPRRASIYYSNQTDKIPSGMPKRERQIRFRIVFFCVLGMVIFYAFIYAWVFVVEPTVTHVSNRWEAGASGMFICGANVGHNGFSRFIADDNNGDVIVVEVVGKKYTIYTVETITVKEQRVVTLEVKDVNGDGKPDLIVNIEGMSPVVLLNNGRIFTFDGK